MISKAWLAAFAFLGLFAPLANARSLTRVIHVDDLEIRYDGHVSGRDYRPHYSRDVWDQLYTSVSIRSHGGPVHRVKTEPEDGFFVASADPAVSPGGAYVVLEQLSGGYASDGNQQWWHDVSYCVFVETSTARVVTQETGDYCGGEFTGPATWVSDTGLKLDLTSLSR
jgi:hypothetical protein